MQLYWNTPREKDLRPLPRCMLTHNISWFTYYWKIPVQSYACSLEYYTLVKQVVVMVVDVILIIQVTHAHEFPTTKLSAAHLE